MDARTSLLLRAGIAFAFVYPAIAAYLDPISWIGYFPVFMRDFAGTGNELVLLHTFGLSELAIAAWLLFGKNHFIPGALAALYLGAIVILNAGQMDVVFRDLSILLMALAIALDAHRKKPGTAGVASGA